MNAGPAAGVFHSVTSQASAVPTSSPAKTPLARQVARAAAVSRTAAASSTASAALLFPASVSSGSPEDRDGDGSDGDECRGSQPAASSGSAGRSS